MIQVDGPDQQNELYQDIIQRDVYRLRTTPPNEVSHFVDIGANVGYVSLMARFLFPEAYIIAMEPVPSTYNALVANVAGMDIKTVKSALGARREKMGLEIWPSSLSSRVTPILLTSQEQCISYGLDTVLLGLKLDTTFLKVDIEGGEWVLWEHVELLKRVGNLAIEFHYDLNSSDHVIQRMTDVFGLTHLAAVTDEAPGRCVVRCWLRR